MCWLLVAGCSVAPGTTAQSVCPPAPEHACMCVWPDLQVVCIVCVCSLHRYCAILNICWNGGAADAPCGLLVYCCRVLPAAYYLAAKRGYLVRSKDTCRPPLLVVLAIKRPRSSLHSGCRMPHVRGPEKAPWRSFSATIDREIH